MDVKIVNILTAKSEIIEVDYIKQPSRGIPNNLYFFKDGEIVRKLGRYETVKIFAMGEWRTPTKWNGLV